jgi:hypothetical protein
MQSDSPKGYWNIPELYAWASKRDHAAVEAVGGSEECSAEEADHLMGDALLSDDDGAHVAAWKRHLAGRAEMPTPLDVVYQLPRLFENGELRVYGRLHGQDSPVQIPASAWSVGLAITASYARHSWIAYAPSDPTNQWWDMLRVPSADALKVWPPQTESPASPSAPSKAAPSAPEPAWDDRIVKTWMGGEILKRRRETGEQTDRDSIAMAARIKFDGLGTERSKKLYRALDKDLKGKRGPKGPRNSGQKISAGCRN